MSTGAGTIEQLASELARVFAPLTQQLRDGSPATILASLGLRVPDSPAAAPVNVAVQATVTAAGGISGLIDQLTAALAANDTSQIASGAGSLLDEIVRTVQSASAVVSELQKLTTTASGLTPAQITELTTFAGEFVSRFLNQLLVEYLESRAPQLAILLTITGGIEIVDVPGGPAGSLQGAHTRKTFRFDRTTKLFTDPGGLLKETYSWGQPGFDGLALFTVLQTVMRDQFTQAAEILQPPGLPAALEAFGFQLTVDKTVTPPGLDLDLRVPASLSQNDTIPAGDWDITFAAEVDLAADLQAKLRPPFDVEIDLPTGSIDVSISAGLSRNPTNPLFLFGSANASRLEVQSPGASFALKAHFDTAAKRLTLAPALQLNLKGGQLAISSDGADSFIGTLLAGVNLQSNFDAQLTWNLQQGVSFVGSAALEIGIPTHVTLGPLEITQLFLSLATPSDGSIPIELSAAFAATLGPIEATVDRMGLAAQFRFPQGGGNLGPADLTLAFKPPTGVGLAIDAGVVKGGGFLSFDPDHGEYAGAIELQVFETIAVKAIGIITTKMPDGSRGFSLLILMSVEFSTGIQLGFGFTLLAVGGLLGLNRSVNIQAITDGVRSGAIESLMFPRDIIANAPKIISDLKAFFPPRTGIFLIGPMAKIGWGTPTLISISLAVIIEIPGNIAITGLVQVSLPTADAPVIELNVAFVGAIEFDKHRIWFFASLFDSRILFQTIEGEMGLLMAFGDDANFVVSVGGFHPRFDPPPLPFPTPRRVSTSLINTSVARVSVESYYAITSNTAQFGARADVFFGVVSGLNVQGNLAFDALFQFSPFSFVIDLSASLSVKVFGVGLFSVHLHGTIEGPAPWHIEGHGSISLFFFDIGVDFSVTWGEDRRQELPPISVLPLIQTELNKPDNWRAFLPQGTSLLVSLRQIPADEAPLILHPVGVLRISQRAVPFDLHLDRIGAQKPADVNRISVAVNAGGLQKNADTLEQFAPAQYQDFSDADKLSLPSFSPEHGGLDLGPADDLRSSKMVRRVVRYEEIILDSNAKRFASGFNGYFGVLFNFFLNGAAVARCEISNASRLQRNPFADKIEIHSETFTVAFQANNTAFSTDSAEFHSEASARDFLNRQITADPALADQIHVIPSVERAA